jgi:hypothetical protein
MLVRHLRLIIKQSVRFWASRASTGTFSFSALARSLGEGNLPICCEHFLCSTTSSSSPIRLLTSTPARRAGRIIAFKGLLVDSHRVSPISLVLSRSLSLFPPQVLPDSRTLPFNDLTLSIFLAIALHDPIRAYILEICRLRGQPSRRIWTDTL